MPSTRTTPEATDLHAILAVALERGVTAVVMEVSSHALTLGRVDLRDVVHRVVRAHPQGGDVAEPEAREPQRESPRTVRAAQRAARPPALRTGHAAPVPGD